MNPDILRIKDVVRRTALGRTTILEQVAEGTFPRPIKLSKRAVGWLSAEVDKWLVERMAARDGEKGNV